MIVLGLEASCDETAAAVVDMQAPAGNRIRANIVHSQIDLHRAYGGVVPEIAARAHLDWMDLVIPRALDAAGCTMDDLDLITATCGPGLVGGLVVSAMAGRAMALALSIPYQDTNHLAGHALTARLTDDVPYPYLLLLVSGGHSQLLIVEGAWQFTPLGSTIDDAVGEAFDKIAKLLDLGFPGGPAVEACATSGDPNRFDLPIPLKNKPDFNFSFSGLKTAVRRALELTKNPNDQDKADLCASFQRAAAASLHIKTQRAMAHCRQVYGRPLPLAVSGGVAANGTIRSRLDNLAAEFHVPLYAAPLSLCGDNAAMIAYAGGEQWNQKQELVWDRPPQPRWALNQLNQFP